MKTTKVPNPLAPQKGKRPNFDGVSGTLITTPVGLEFSVRKLRISPYDALLDQLEKAGPGHVLCFDDIRARASVIVRSKKKGLRISFAEHDGKLFVRFDGSTKDDVDNSRRGRLRELLKIGPLTSIKACNKLRDSGDTLVDANITELILLSLMKSGEVIRQDGGAFGLNPLKKAHSAG